MSKPRCYFEGRGPCDGRLIKAHWISRQRIKRAFPRGGVRLRFDLQKFAGTPSVRALNRGEEMPEERVGEEYGLPIDPVPLEELLWDPRVWCWCCGGPVGLSGHHGLLDSRRLPVLRRDLPEALEDFARETGLVWSLDHDYGPLESEAA